MFNPLLAHPFPPAPATPIDDSGAPRLGVFAGSLEAIDLSPLLPRGPRGWLKRQTRLKRWQYAMITTEEVVLCLAIVDLGYASNAFCYAVDRAERALVFDRGFLGLPANVEIADRPGKGARSHFLASGVALHFERVGSRYLGTARIDPQLSLNFTLETAGAATPVSMVVPIRGGAVNVTQKSSALPATGTLVIGGKRYVLDGGSGGMDFTHGLLSREVVWRWAFAAGQTPGGAPIGFNLETGMNDGVRGHDVLWLGGEPSLLPAVTFAFDPRAPLEPWRVQSADGQVDLRFQPLGAHREQRNLGLARSRFVQVAGEFSGHLIDAAGERVDVARLPGVVEDQVVRW